MMTRWIQGGAGLIAALCMGGMTPALGAAELPAAIGANALPDAAAGPSAAARSGTGPASTATTNLGAMYLAAAADPTSRDELFGVAAPSSRDALFDDVAPKAVRLSGFVDGLAAYTYADPEHWSRAVGRLELTAQGRFGAAKWKASGRVDADPVYLSSGFYPDAVKRDQRLDFFYRENYVDFSAWDWDFRVGAQQIVWGEVVGLYFADVVSARDMREFLLPGFDIMRIPQWAARAEYTTARAHVEFIFIPVPAFDLIGKPGSDFYPVPLPSPTPPEVAALFRDPQRPERSLRNANFGVRANTLLNGWDLAAFYYRSYSTSPTFYRLPGETATQPFIFQPRYDRIWQTGGTLSQDLGGVVLRGEAVYTHGQNFSVADLQTANSTVSRPTLDAIASLEWALPGDTRLNVQAFQRHYFGGGSDGIAIANDGFGASLFVSTKISATLEPQLLWIRNFHDGGALIRPRLNWAAARNVTVSFGADVFTGPMDTFFGRFGNRDRGYTEVRLDF